MSKIAILTPFLSHGGLEKVAVTGAEYLKNHYDTTLIVFDTFKVDYKYSGKIVDLKVKLYGLNSINKILNLFKAMGKLKKLQKDEKFDLIIVHGELSNIATISNIFPKKVVVIHENRLEKKHSTVKNICFNYFIKRIYNSKNTNKIVTVSSGIRESFIRKFDVKDTKIKTIHNPYDINAIIKKSKEDIDDKYKDLFIKNNVLLIVARLTEAKGIKFFFNIYVEYIKNNTNTKLVLFGDGELRDELINLANSLNLRTYSVFYNDCYSNEFDVYFLGFHENPYKYMRNSKLFIMSSIWEGFGNTLVESMACETPVISTDCKSGPKEVISPSEKKEIKSAYFAKYGILMPIHKNNIDIDIWIKTINKVLNDKNIYNKYQKMGLQRAKHFGIEIIMKQWKSFIDELL